MIFGYMRDVGRAVDAAEAKDQRNHRRRTSLALPLHLLVDSGEYEPSLPS
jgi:hypothetical protein